MGAADSGDVNLTVGAAAEFRDETQQAETGQTGLYILLHVSSVGCLGMAPQEPRRLSRQG